MFVFGKKIKLDNGKIAILFGNFSFFVIIFFINYTMSKSNLIASLLQSGISAAQKGEFKKAKEIFLKIIDLNDNILSVYLNIIEFYKKKFPKKIFDLDLEKLTLQKEEKAKEVFDFCNIKWDIKSLEFYKRKDLLLKTASVKQIRERIYHYDKDKFAPYKNLAINFYKEFPWLKKYV